MSDKAKIWLCVLFFVGGICVFTICELCTIFWVKGFWVGFGMMAFGVVALVLSICVLVGIIRHIGRYECRNCGEIFLPRFGQFFWAPHTPNLRYMKCPHCAKRTWCRFRWAKGLNGWGAVRADGESGDAGNRENPPSGDARHPL